MLGKKENKSLLELFQRPKLDQEIFKNSFRTFCGQWNLQKNYDFQLLFLFKCISSGQNTGMEKAKCGHDFLYFTCLLISNHQQTYILKLRIVLNFEKSTKTSIPMYVTPISPPSSSN